MDDPAWPAPAAALAEARALFAERGGETVAIACDSDVDGLAAAVIVTRVVERRGGTPRVVVAHRGEHAHVDSMRERMRASAPRLLVVVDLGSRAGPILPGVPTLLVDHHRPDGFPDGAVVVSAFGHEPVAPTGLLALELFRPLVPVNDLEWLAVLATMADLGSVKPFPTLATSLRRYGRGHVTRAVSLLNAARRAGRFQGEQALAVLLAAKEPADIALHRVDGTDLLEACRVEVAAEVARVSKTAPRVAGRVALIRFSSSAQVHPLVATRWTSRLRGKIVVAANDGYVPGLVSFAMRTSDPDVDLIAYLRSLPVVRELGGELAHGHPRATGGRVPPQDFERILDAMGFER